MSDNELLSAIANMMNKNTHALEYRMDEMQKELTTRIDSVEQNLQNQINMLDTKIDSVEQNLQHQINMLDAKIDSVDARIDSIDARIDSIDARIDGIDTRIDNVDAKIHKINLNLENNIEPRLRHIEECYTSTYTRYKVGVEKQEKMQLDIEVLQDVVKEHGKILQAITA